MEEDQVQAQAANEEVEYSSSNPEPIQLKESEVPRNKNMSNALHATEEYINHTVK
jgi:hypothetical protein